MKIKLPTLTKTQKIITAFVLVVVISFLVSLYDTTIGRLIPILIPIVLKYGLTGLTKKAFANEKKQPNAEADSH